MSEDRFKRGSAFMRPPTEREDDHLHIILTKPMLHGKGRKQKVKVIMVNTTSIKGRHDETYDLKRGDHAEIKIPSYIYYKEAKVITVEKLEQELRRGKIEIKDDFDIKKVKEILKKLPKASNVSKLVKDFYRDYRLSYNESRNRFMYTRVIDYLPEAGLEPARSYLHKILSLECLPIPPFGLSVF